MVLPLKLSDEQLNDFKEIGNIGTGFAASKIADEIGMRCNIGLPQVVTINANIEEGQLSQSDAFSVAVSIRMQGDFEANMFLMTSTRSADMIIDKMEKTASQRAGNIVDLSREYALKKLGENMIGGYATAVNNFLQTKYQMLPPELTIDLWNKALNKILGKLIKIDGDQILIQSSFYAPDKSFQGMFAYVINRISQRHILSKIYDLTRT